MTRRYPKCYGEEEIQWMETVFEPIWKQENRANSISNARIDSTVDIDTVEADDNTVRHFFDCRLNEIGGKRLRVLYHAKSDFSEAAKLLCTKEATLRSWIYRLRLGLQLTGADRFQVSRTLCTPCDETVSVVNTIETL